MDDVGQTLLNWASAFGTQEMVEFLCDRGADVNRGLRSSSLHYAACFGRPNIVKVSNHSSGSNYIRIYLDKHVSVWLVPEQWFVEMCFRSCTTCHLRNQAVDHILDLRKSLKRLTFQDTGRVSSKIFSLLSHRNVQFTMCINRLSLVLQYLVESFL